MEGKEYILENNTVIALMQDYTTFIHCICRAILAGRIPGPCRSGVQTVTAHHTETIELRNLGMMVLVEGEVRSEKSKQALYPAGTRFIHVKK